MTTATDADERSDRRTGICLPGTSAGYGPSVSTSSPLRSLNPANVMTALRVLLVPVIIVLLLIF